MSRTIDQGLQKKTGPLHRNFESLFQNKTREVISGNGGTGTNRGRLGEESGRKDKNRKQTKQKDFYRKVRNMNLWNERK
jgi:hypothetical protein